MAKISILPLAEPGHINATIRLGHELGAAGHDVRFCGAAEDEPLFAPHGVAFAPLPRVLGRYGPEYRWDGDPSELALVDAILFRPAIDACRAGKRVISLSTTFPAGYDPEVPPITSSLLPAGDAAGRAQRRAAWEAVRRGHEAVVERHEHNDRRDSTLSILHGFARERGWPREQLDERAAINPLVRLPELVLAPAQLDFPRRPLAARRYGGPCVNIERGEEPFEPTGSGSGRPLVFASFGSQAHRYPLDAALALLGEAARQLPHLSFVFATGGRPLRDLPPNVQALARAPQLAVLRRASLMISHGGLNGIKEALFFGVPLLVLPFAWDQPGNAARVAFHRLGQMASWDGMSPGALASLIRATLDDEEVRHRVARLAATLGDEHARPMAAEALAELLRQDVADAAGG